MADNNNLSDLGNEVNEIKKAFAGLERRLGAVENALLQSKPAVNKISHAKEETQLKKSSAAQEQLTGIKSISDQRPSENKNLETRIGQYWLNKLGIISLVIGVVFLILYSFQYFNAGLKLLTGILVAAFLIVFGDRIAKDKERKWYGHGLMGGGWAIAYFVVYAMYFIPNLKVIDSYWLESGSLIVVCGLAMLQAVYRQAEIIAILAITLANISIGLSGSSLLSNIPILVIALIGTAVALKQNWCSLFVWLIIASYIGHSFASSEAYSYSTIKNTDAGWVTGGCLLSFWLIFNIAMLFCKEETNWQRKTAIIASCINALAFGMCILVLSRYYFVHQRNLAVGLTGACYLALAILLHRCQLNQLKTTNILIGLSFINIAIWMKFTGAPVAVFNLVELGLLAFAGLRSNIKAFRWFALYLSFCFFPLWFAVRTDDNTSSFVLSGSSRLILVGALATAVFAIICWLYRKKEYIDTQGNIEKHYYQYIYFCLANVSAWFTPWAIENKIRSLFFWSLQPIVCSIASIECAELFFGQMGLLGAIYASLALLFTVSDWQWLPITFIVAACFAFYAYTRQKLELKDPLLKDHLFVSYSKRFSVIAGTILLTVLFLEKLSTFWLSTGLALEGLILVAGGFFLKDRLIRIPGLFVLALLTFKLLFVDLAQANTLQRIISFIAAGIVFLLASYTYSKFAEKFAGADDNKMP